MAIATVGGHIERRRRMDCLVLRYSGSEMRVAEGKELLIGRGAQCHVRIPSSAASRIHATVKCQNGNLILSDRSTNGTYVRTQPGRRSTDNAELYLHHDEWTTDCSASLSLGRPIDDGDVNLIRLECH
jgi:pSer/pThr/pTyr-binding forkhead associated (FHA) protein